MGEDREVVLQAEVMVERAGRTLDYDIRMISAMHTHLCCVAGVCIATAFKKSVCVATHYKSTLHTP